LTPSVKIVTAKGKKPQARSKSALRELQGENRGLSTLEEVNREWTGLLSHTSKRKGEPSTAEWNKAKKKEVRPSLLGQKKVQGAEKNGFKKRSQKKKCPRRMGAKIPGVEVAAKRRQGRGQWLSHGGMPK